MESAGILARPRHTFTEGNPLAPSSRVIGGARFCERIGTPAGVSGQTLSVVFRPFLSTDGDNWRIRPFPSVHAER
jgi:hypothetical protein